MSGWKAAILTCPDEGLFDWNMYGSQGDIKEVGEI